jgi:hypothetical protein
MISRDLLISISCSGILLSTLAASAEARPRAYHRSNHRHEAQRTYGCPVRKSPDGSLIDCRGWRKRDSGWDNTCLNVPYLPDIYACGSVNGHR